MHRRNVFAGPYLDRVAHLRHDARWLAQALTDARSVAIPVWNSRSLVADPPRSLATPGGRADSLRAAYIDLASIRQGGASVGEFIFLGSRGDAHYFAWEIEASEPPELRDDARFQDLRTVSALLDAEEAGLLAYARAMVSWRRTHRFCGRCGSSTAPEKGGHVLRCTQPSCGHETFPRLDPAIIVLVSDGDEALLGRQASWPAGRYSTIAGFVEPGESLEDAVAREVAEETGVIVKDVQYHSSQPWPFPSSLMLGFVAQAASREIRLQDQELEDARWISREDILAGRVLTPPSQSISFSLIEQWFDAAGGRRLREVAGSTPWPTTR
ncbi:MAG: NAD(+) diphosphatase [Steroidobacteraceae bacterium]